MNNTLDLLESSESRIAIISMAGRFPGASNCNELWEVLKSGKETITHFTEEELRATEPNPKGTFSNPNYIKSRGVMENADKFDAEFFQYTPREAAVLDPQHRIWLEVAWEALESAGYCNDAGNNSIGVFTGTTNSNYLLHNLLQSRSDIEEFVRLRQAKFFSQFVGNNSSFLATRTSYKLDLNGPSINVQTACSTSLVAVVMAVQSLLNYESDICIAGGITVSVPQTSGHFHREGGIGSNDGHCRPFDADAGGTVFSSGAGAVVLKRLDDAIEANDNILAVVRGAAMNNDGGKKVSYMAPSVDGQAEVIGTALSLADVAPGDISYIEAHGTATPIGDPIEISALSKIFAESPPEHKCAISSIKGNIGHLDAAAGVAGLIKTVLAMQHKKLPATVHFKKPNPLINFDATPFFVVDGLTDWSANGKPRRAGVSAFGIGGTNAHVILEEAPAVTQTSPCTEKQLMLFSANNEDSLARACSNVADYLATTPTLNMADAAYTMQTARRRFSKRHFVVCDPVASTASEQVRTRKPSGAGTAPHDTSPEESTLRLAFMFPGQGAAYHSMGQTLHRSNAVFRDTFDQCCEIANRFTDIDMKESLLSSDEAAFESVIGHNATAQLAGFILDYCVARVFMGYNATPDLLLGHSLGEWVSACIAGVLSLDQSIEAVFHRGRLMESVAGGGGAISVVATEKEIEPFLGNGVTLACTNAPQLCLLSGPKKKMDQTLDNLKEAGLRCSAIPISVAVHSEVLDDVIEPFEQILRGFTFSPPQIPMYSPAWGGLLPSNEAANPAFWASQMRKQVQFSSALKAMLTQDAAFMLEVGPGSALKSLASRHSEILGRSFATTSMPPNAKRDEQEQLLGAIGQLWKHGFDIDWQALHHGETRRITAMPTYAFEKQRHWVAPPDLDAALNNGIPSTYGGPAVSGTNCDDSSATESVKIINGSDKTESNASFDTLVSIWSEVLGIVPQGPNADFYDLGAESFQVIQMLESVASTFGVSIPLSKFPEVSTLAKFADLLNLSTADAQKSSTLSLVAIKDGDMNKPIFFMPHGVAGTVHWGYANIAMGFEADQAIYGFKVPVDMQFSSFQEMAAFYIKDMKTLQPEGPYLLGGYCYGGNVAYEMATQLTEAGDEVAFLAMIEAWPINSSYGAIKVTPGYLYRFATNLPGLLSDFAARPPQDQLRSFKSKSKQMAGKLTDKLRAIPQKLESTAETDSCEPATPKAKRAIRMVDMVDIERYSKGERNIWESLIQLQVDNVPRPCQSTVDVFRAHKQPLTSPLDYSLGWEELALKGVMSHVVPGSHFSVVDAAHGKQLGAVMAKRLDEILRNK